MRHDDSVERMLRAGPLTRSQIIEQGIPSVKASPTLRKLERYGIVEVKGTVVCPVTHHRSKLWGLVQ